MQKKDILKLLSDVGAVITNSHIIYTSGKHGSAYINKDAVYPHTQLTSALCKIIAKKFLKSEIEVVIAPVIGGVILSQWVSYHLSKMSGRQVLGVYAEKHNDDFVIKRGYDKLICNRRILVVEDVLNTGGSVKKVVEATKNAGGQVVAVASLCNRGNVQSKDLGDVPELYSLVQINLDAWEETECPLCAQGIPINVEVGKGREYIAKKKR